MKLLATSIAAITLICGSASGDTKIRVGHFPNITHAQGVIAHALSRQGKGWFEERLGPDIKIEWFVYNAGPSAMEAVFAKSIDLAYVGPGPALTTSDVVGPALAAEQMFHATCLNPDTGRILRGLGDLEPRTLAIMHGRSFQGDGKRALYDLAAGYEGLSREGA